MKWTWTRGRGGRGLEERSEIQHREGCPRHNEVLVELVEVERKAILSFLVCPPPQSLAGGWLGGSAGKTSTALLAGWGAQRLPPADEEFPTSQPCSALLCSAVGGCLRLPLLTAAPPQPCCRCLALVRPAPPCPGPRLGCCDPPQPLGCPPLLLLLLPPPPATPSQGQRACGCCLLTSLPAARSPSTDRDAVGGQGQHLWHR